MTGPTITIHIIAADGPWRTPEQALSGSRATAAISVPVDAAPSPALLRAVADAARDIVAARASTLPGSSGVGQAPRAPDALLDRLRAILDRLEGDELAVAAMVLERLDVGRERYGVLDVRGGRRWRREALEEMVDGAVYMSCALVEGAGGDGT